MPIAHRDIQLTAERYLTLEQTSEIKHEFINGYIYAMTEASRAHNFIAGALYSSIRTHFRGQNCRVYTSDMKVHVHTKSDEVLSDSTESKDRLEKLNAYTRLTSLQEYVLISQHKVNIDIYRKVASQWELNTYSAGEPVDFNSIGLNLPIETIYEDVIGQVN